jgi:hypothetical protein
MLRGASPMASLHNQIVEFFQSRMATHTSVARCTRLNVADEYLYSIERKDGLEPINVLLSDAYWYGHAAYVGRPKQIRRGDFIIIARPEADFDEALIEPARKDGIGIGKIGKFMGALNKRNVCDYISPEEKKRKKR